MSALRVFYLGVAFLVAFVLALTFVGALAAGGLILAAYLIDVINRAW